jgi:prolyl oligopeptidase PreP (S9A serine peptidase family)
MAGRADDLRLSGFKSLVLWHYGKSLENAIELFENAGQNLQVIHSQLYNPPNRPKFSSGKVLIPYVIRMIIKFS